MSRHQKELRCGIARCAPSLALMKYWGKADRTENLPATSSIAITLDELCTETRVYSLEVGSRPARDLVIVNGIVQDPLRYAAYFDELRKHLGTGKVFWAESINNFPTASGLASSSSGFAALTCAAFKAWDHEAPPSLLSDLARLGSASASRSLFGGFTLLEAGARHAEPLFGPSYWPELRVVVVRVKEGPKESSSRNAMESTRTTSPFYRAWVEDSRELVPMAIEALRRKDLETLGPLVRKSYSRMFATMLGNDPPLLYWHPDSVGLIRLCADLRASGTGVWETMDAGPQVKIFLLDKDLPVVMQRLQDEYPGLFLMVDKAGPGPSYPDRPQYLGDPHLSISQAAASLDLGL